MESGTTAGRATTPDQPSKRRFPPRVYRRGQEPDPRFSLANERTFLAWIRTSLASLALAGGLLALDLPVQRSWALSAAAVFAVASLAASVCGWIGWARAELQLRLGQPLRGQGAGAGLAALMTTGTALVLVGFLTEGVSN